METTTAAPLHRVVFQEAKEAKVGALQTPSLLELAEKVPKRAIFLEVDEVLLEVRIVQVGASQREASLDSQASEVHL